MKKIVEYFKSRWLAILIVIGVIGFIVSIFVIPTIGDIILAILGLVFVTFMIGVLAEIVQLFLDEYKNKKSR